jgi:Arc/MetJ family transcription regulator
MLIKYANQEHKVRTTLFINEQLLEEAKKVSGAKTKKEAVEIALEELVRRKKAEKLIELEGKIELSFTLSEFLKRRKKDVLYR